MKKILSVILMGMLCIILVGCGNDNDPGGNNNNNNNNNNNVCWDVMPCSLIGKEQVAKEFIITYLPELRV